MGGSVVGVKGEEEEERESSNKDGVWKGLKQGWCLEGAQTRMVFRRSSNEDGV